MASKKYIYNCPGTIIGTYLPLVIVSVKTKGKMCFKKLKKEEKQVYITRDEIKEIFPLFKVQRRQIKRKHSKTATLDMEVIKRNKIKKQ